MKNEPILSNSTTFQFSWQFPPRKMAKTSKFSNFMDFIKPKTGQFPNWILFCMRACDRISEETAQQQTTLSHAVCLPLLAGVCVCMCVLFSFIEWSTNSVFSIKDNNPSPFVVIFSMKQQRQTRAPWMSVRASQVNRNAGKRLKRTCILYTQYVLHTLEHTHTHTSAPVTSRYWAYYQ